MKGYLISDVLTRDAIVIGQVRRDTALYELPPLRTGKPGRPRKYGDRITKAKLKRFHKRARNCRSTAATAPFAIAPPSAWSASSAVVLSEPFGYRCSSMANGKRNGFCCPLIRVITAEDVIMTYSLRWTIEPMFAALKWGEGMIDMWMQSVETFHRWLTIVQIGRALIQMLAVKADATTTALAQVAAWRKERYLTAGMVKAGLVRAFWNIAPAEAWHRRGRKFDPSRCVPMRTRVVRTASAA